MKRGTGGIQTRIDGCPQRGKNRMLRGKVQVRIDGMSAARPGVSGILRRMDEGGDWAGQLAEMFNR